MGRIKKKRTQRRTTIAAAANGTNGNGNGKAKHLLIPISSELHTYFRVKAIGMGRSMQDAVAADLQALYNAQPLATRRLVSQFTNELG